MPRCGNCHQSHPTVADIRACYEHSADKFVNDTGLKPASDPMWPASEAQANYIVNILQKERILPDDYQVKTYYDVMAMEKDVAGSVITLLKSFPRKDSGTSQKQWTMPEGRYAIWHEEELTWWFFQVDKPTKGRWDGYTFIKRLIGAPGQYNKINMQASERVGWLTAIEKDPRQAMLDYGLHSGACGRCGSPLSDPTSLSLGMGPHCRNKSGWF